jgi:hypothetical protein
MRGALQLLQRGREGDAGVEQLGELVKKYALCVGARLHLPNFGVQTRARKA